MLFTKQFHLKVYLIAVQELSTVSHRPHRQIHFSHLLHKVDVETSHDSEHLQHINDCPLEKAAVGKTVSPPD